MNHKSNIVLKKIKAIKYLKINKQKYGFQLLYWQ